MSLLSDWIKKLTQLGVPSTVEVPSVNLDQFQNMSVNTDQFSGGDFETVNKQVTGVTSQNILENQYVSQAGSNAMDVAQATEKFYTRDIPNMLANPYDAFSYKPGEGTLGKSLGMISMERLGLSMPDFGMGGIGGSGGGGGGGDSGGGSPDTSTETTMTASEKRDKLRQLMASRYGKRETILTSGTGVAGFGV